MPKGRTQIKYWFINERFSFDIISVCVLSAYLIYKLKVFMTKTETKEEIKKYSFPMLSDSDDFTVGKILSIPLKTVQSLIAISNLQDFSKEVTRWPNYMRTIVTEISTRDGSLLSEYNFNVQAWQLYFWQWRQWVRYP